MINVELTADAPRLEVAFLTTATRSTHLRLRKLRFWRC
jgi:hypothetical protein